MFGKITSGHSIQNFQSTLDLKTGGGERNRGEQGEREEEEEEREEEKEGKEDKGLRESVRRPQSTLRLIAASSTRYIFMMYVILLSQYSSIDSIILVALLPSLRLPLGHDPSL